MKPFFLTIITVLFVFITSVDAQKLTTKSEKARDFFLKGYDSFSAQEFDVAEEFFMKSISVDPDYFEAHIRLSELYKMQKLYSKEEKSLLNALEIDSTYYIVAFFDLGVAQFQLGKYDSSILNFEHYIKYSRDSINKLVAKRNIANNYFAKKSLLNPIQIKMDNMGDKINSRYDEYWPSLRGDEEEIVFTVLVPRDSIMFTNKLLPRHPKFFHEDFYISKTDSLGNWSERFKMSSNINTDGNEGAQSLSVNGQWMFYTACRLPDCDIFFSVATPNGWSKPVRLDYPLNTGVYDGQPCFSADGKTLYFRSNRSGGFGSNDIWKVEIVAMKQDGTPVFGNLKNLGPSINTAMDEFSPFIHPDGKTLYFSSDGWPGMGQMDIFLSRKNINNEWCEPINFGYPANSSSDEVGFVLNAKGDRGYFSTSNLDNEFCDRDLITFEMPDTLRPTPASYLKGRVFDATTKMQLKANFELFDVESSELTVKSSTNYNGEFLVCLPIGGNYAVNVSKSGYLFHSQNVNLLEASIATQPLVADIYLKPITVNAKIVLENIFFETASSELHTNSKVELNMILLFLEQNPSVSIELSGHTDNVGTAEYNKTLSLNRAKAVQSFLESKGVLANRLKTVGYGFSKPIDSNDTPQGRAKNRRTEMRIVK